MQGSKDQTLMMQSAAQQLLCLCVCLWIPGIDVAVFFFVFFAGGEGLVFQNVKVLGVINISLAFRHVFLFFASLDAK